MQLEVFKRCLNFLASLSLLSQHILSHCDRFYLYLFIYFISLNLSNTFYKNECQFTSAITTAVSVTNLWAGGNTSLCSRARSVPQQEPWAACAQLSSKPDEQHMELGTATPFLLSWY